MPERDSSIVVLVSPRHQVLIDRLTADKRLREGLGMFKGNTKIHRSIKGDAIPDPSGKCRWCGTQPEPCRPVRVSLLESTAPRFTGQVSGKRMRVKGNRKGRKKRFDAPLLREIEPSSVQVEREISKVSDFGWSAIYSKLDHVDTMIRLFELEEKRTQLNGGDDAVTNLRQYRRDEFLKLMSQLRGNGRGRLMAEYMVKLMHLVFPDPAERRTALLPFNALIDELESEAKRHKQSREEAHRKALRDGNEYMERRAKIAAQLIVARKHPGVEVNVTNVNRDAVGNLEVTLKRSK